jgi:hypothetical protein
MKSSARFLVGLFVLLLASSVSAVRGSTWTRD